jgi:signal peptidase I
MRKLFDYLKSHKFKQGLREWIEALVVAGILAILVRSFIIEPYKIPSGSMIPTLKIGDRILVNKFIYGAKIPFTLKHLPKLTDPKRGDVVVFYHLEDKKNFIKRLVAFEGETVEIKNGTICIDSKPLDEPIFRKIYYYNRGVFAEGFKFIVPAGHLFVLGDNSGSSRDSRFWGGLDKRYLLGKAWIIIWPVKRIGLIK